MCISLENSVYFGDGDGANSNLVIPKRQPLYYKWTLGFHNFKRHHIRFSSGHTFLVASRMPHPLSQYCCRLCYLRQIFWSLKSLSRFPITWQTDNAWTKLHNRAGLGYSYSVLVLAVLLFWYSYCTRTHEFQSHSTRTCTRTQVLGYSYEYWHEYWYSMVHLHCKGENHHIFEINSMTYHKGKVPNWFNLL